METERIELSAKEQERLKIQIDGALSQLRRGMRVLVDHDIKTIVLVTDHGHLFADELGGI